MVILWSIREPPYGRSPVSVRSVEKPSVGLVNLWSVSEPTDERNPKCGKIPLHISVSAIDCVENNTLWQVLKEKGASDHFIGHWKNLYVGQEATVRTFQTAQNQRPYMLLVLWETCELQM